MPPHAAKANKQNFELFDSINVQDSKTVILTKNKFFVQFLINERIDSNGSYRSENDVYAALLLPGFQKALSGFCLVAAIDVDWQNVHPSGRLNRLYISLTARSTTGWMLSMVARKFGHGD
uniref:Uncharacterized protein n=1 Tax=Romanomermis culicivorax TaxID=13658 RepID=A0A915IXD7_ROMCU